MLSKVSYLFIYIRIVSGSTSTLKGMRILFVAFMAFVMTWGIGSAIALALQCQTPAPWNVINNQCVNQAALYYSVGVLNIITDVAIILMPALIVFNLQIRRRERASIWIIFATRLAVVAAAIVQLCVLGSYLSSTDLPWLNTIPTIWGQVMVNLSVITACIPLVKPFLDVLQFSLVDTSTLPFSVQAGFYAETYGDRSYPWSRSSKEKNSAPKPQTGGHRWRRGRDSYSLGAPRV